MMCLQSPWWTFSTFIGMMRHDKMPNRQQNLYLELNGHILWWLLPFLLLQWSGAVCLIVVLAHSIFRLPGLGLHINKHMALLWHLGLHGLCQQDWAWRCETMPESKHLASYQQGKVLYHRVTPFSLKRHFPLHVWNWNVGTSIDSKKYQNLDYKRWLWVKSSYDGSWPFPHGCEWE